MSTPSARIAGHGPHVRAGDADREQIADRLRSSHSEGRIDLNEFQQRLERCYEAKTFGELGTLVSDLPSDDRAAPVAARRTERRPRLVLPLIAFLFVLMVASAGAWHHGHHPPFFLIVPVIFLIWRMAPRRRPHWSTGTRGGPGRWA